MTYIIYLLILICIYIFLIYWLRPYIQRKLIFHPVQIPKSEHNEPIDPNFKEFNVLTSDYLFLNGLVYKHPNDTNNYVLYSHGNSGNIYNRYEVIKDFSTMFNANVIAYDYRGFGKSQGIPSIEGLDIDAEAILSYVQGGLGIKPENLILCGVSLGCYPTLYLANRVMAKAVVVVSGFSSLYDIANDLFPLMSFMAPDELNNTKLIQKVNYPVYILHSRVDELIPFKHANKLHYHGSDGTNQCKLLEIGGIHSQPQYNEKIRQELRQIF